MERYYKKTKNFSHLLSVVPFIRAIILNGSLAMGTATKDSDIDLLVIAKTGRIFTVRFFVNFVGIITGQKRPFNENRSHAGKFCFNFFLTEDYLKIGYPPGREQYCAKNYAASVLIWGKEQLFDNFMKENKTLLGSWKKMARVNKISNLPIGIKTNMLQIFLERILTGRVGDWFEQTVKAWQIRKILTDPRTSLYSDAIVFNDHELRFHPPKII